MNQDWIHLAIRQEGRTVSHRNRVLYRGSPLGEQLLIHPNAVGYANFDKQVWPVFLDSRGVHFVEVSQGPMKATRLQRRLIHD